MRLQRMATYRLVRIMRAVLPVIVIVLIVVPARNYWRSSNRVAPPEPKSIPTAADIQVHTLDLKFQKYDQGRALFTLTAREQFFSKDNKHKLRDVSVVIYGEKPGDFDRVIKGDNCLYDEVTGNIQFSGNVKAQLEATTSTQTGILVYNHDTRTISSPVRTHVEQPGEMTGDADRMEYLILPELLRLSGNVGMQMSNGEALHTNFGEFQRKENWATVSGGVFLEASNGWLRGNGGRADLQPGTYRPTIVTIEGDVTSESGSPNSPDRLKTSSEHLTSIISAEGAIQTVLARGNVTASQISKDENQAITGSEVAATLDAHGRVNTMDVRQPTAPYAKVVTTQNSGPGVPSSGNTANARSLISDSIHIESNAVSPNSKTVKTTEHSTLVSGDTTISGREFQIRKTDTEMKFDTSSPASLSSVSKTGGQRKTSGDTTSALINGKTNTLDSLTHIGNFRFEEGARTGAADRAVITEGGNRTELTGNFSFVEGKRSGAANSAIISDNGNTIEMLGAVSFKDGLRHGYASHAIFRNGGEDVLLESPNRNDSRAKVVDDEKKREILARTITLNQKTNAFEATTDVFTSSTADSEDLRVTSAHAKSVGDSIQYDGNVNLYRGKTTHIRAETITPDKDNGFTATGKVESQMEGMNARADKLEYSDLKKFAVYTGNVHAKKDDKKGAMNLDAADMTIVLDNAKSGDSKSQQSGQLKELQANGHVNVTQGARKGTGEHLIYDYKTDHVTMTAGSELSSIVIVADPDQGILRGARAQWTGTGGKISLDNPARVPSTIKVK